jgi:hypothetical protein
MISPARINQGFPGFPMRGNIPGFPDFRRMSAIGKVLWTPAEITTALWLDAADSDSLTLDGSDKVSQWDDKSGNGKHAVQLTDTLQPIYNSLLKTIEFSNNYLSGEPIGIHDKSIGIFVVASHNAVSFESTYNGLFHFGSHIVLASYPFSGRQNFYFRNGAIGVISDYYTYDLAGGEPLSILAVKKIIDTYVRIEKDASLVSGGEFTGTIADITSDGTYKIGYQSALSSNYWEGAISEIIVAFDDYEKIEGYLAHKWGLEANLPSDHPYKTKAPYK